VDVTEYHRDVAVVLLEAKCLLLRVGVVLPALGTCLKAEALCAFET
jgi:hypothetical protein